LEKSRGQADETGEFGTNAGFIGSIISIRRHSEGAAGDVHLINQEDFLRAIIAIRNTIKCVTA